MTFNPQHPDPASASDPCTVGSTASQNTNSNEAMDPPQQESSRNYGIDPSFGLMMMFDRQQQLQHHRQQQCKLFIGGLGQVNDDALRQYYTQWGQVVDCIVIREPGSRASRGFGFITYATPEMADLAMSHRPHKINGKAVDAKPAVPRERMNPFPVTDRVPFFMNIEPESGCRLQLSSLNWEWHTLDTLRTYFGQFGAVEQIEMVAFPRGFGSVVYQEQAAAQLCLAVGDKHSVNGHPVEVKLATDGPLLCAPARPNSSDSMLSSASSTHQHRQSPNALNLIG